MKNKSLENLIIFLIVPLYLLNPFYKGFIFGYIAILIIWFSKIEFKIRDVNIVFLAIFSICYACFYAFDLTLGTQFVFMYLVLPVTFYIIGKIIAEKFTPTKF